MEAITHKKHEINTVQDLINWIKTYKKVRIVGLHKLAGQEAEFICMVDSKGNVPDHDQETSKDLRCRVKTLKHNLTVDLKSQNCEFIEKKI